MGRFLTLLHHHPLRPLQILKEEQARHHSTERTLEDTRSELLEVTTQYELQIDTLRIQNLDLTRQLRQVHVGQGSKHEPRCHASD